MFLLLPFLNRRNSIATGIKMKCMGHKMYAVLSIYAVYVFFSFLFARVFCCVIAECALFVIASNRP